VADGRSIAYPPTRQLRMALWYELLTDCPALGAQAGDTLRYAPEEENPVQLFRRLPAGAKAAVWPAIESGVLRPILNDEIVLSAEHAERPVLQVPDYSVSRRQGLRLMKGA
jgi:hypothetical protein